MGRRKVITGQRAKIIELVRRRYDPKPNKSRLPQGRLKINRLNRMSKAKAWLVKIKNGVKKSVIKYSN